MRRCLELMAVLSTTLALVATSRAPEPCASETVTLSAEGTCGEASTVIVTSTAGCTATLVGAEDAGLPSRGNLFGGFNDAGVLRGMYLSGPVVDGGTLVSCTVRSADAGLTFECESSCPPDAGLCPPACSGTLTP